MAMAKYPEVVYASKAEEDWNEGLFVNECPVKLCRQVGAQGKIQVGEYKLVRILSVTPRVELEEVVEG